MYNDKRDVCKLLEYILLDDEQPLTNRESHIYQHSLRRVQEEFRQKAQCHCWWSCSQECTKHRELSQIVSAIKIYNA